MLKGYTRPFSPQGRASALPPMPWRFAADQTMIHFRADPDVLDSYLPPPMTPNPERRGEAFLWTPNLKCHPVDEAERATIFNPARTQYNVCVIAIPGLFEGKPHLISAFQWCDRDWLVILSWLIGTCAKMGEFRDSGVHPMFERVGSGQTGGLGTTFTRAVSRHGEQLINLSYTPEESIEAADMSFFTSTFPLLSERHVPNFNVAADGTPPDKNAPPVFHDLTEMQLTDSAGHSFVRGKASLNFNAGADNEELGPLQPTEVLGGYRWQTSWVMTGIKVVHDYLAE